MPPLMIFAAGLGTRMRPLTDDRPKPLIEVAGRSLLDRALDLGRAAGAAPIAVNTHYRGAQIARHLQGRDVALSPEPDLILDTGGGLRQALPLLNRGARPDGSPQRDGSKPDGSPQRDGGPVLTLNPDVVWTGPNVLAALAAAWDERMDALLALVPLARATGRQGAGDFSLTEGRLTRRGDFVYAGAQMIRTDLLADIPERAFSLNRLWDVMIARGRAFGMVHPGGWCDVGYPQAIPLAEALLDG